MTTTTRAPLAADKVATMREYVDYQFRDVSGYSFATMRRIAHSALDELNRGNLSSAKLGIQRLGSEAEHALFEKLRQLGVELAT